MLRSPSLLIGACLLFFNFALSGPVYHTFNSGSFKGNKNSRVVYIKMTEAEFRYFEKQYADQLILLADKGPLPENSEKTGDGKLHLDSSFCDSLDSKSYRLCLDSLAIILPADPDTHPLEPDKYDDNRNTLHFLDFMRDVMDGGVDWDELAVLILVVVGILVVAAFLTAGLVAAIDVLRNKNSYPTWSEINIGLTYSENRTNNNLADNFRRVATIASLQYTMGLDRKHFGLGLSGETGYLKLRWSRKNDLIPLLDMSGIYWLFGPVFRLKSESSFNLDFEFLNGFSNINATGWISKSNIVGKWKLTTHMLAGVNVGALFVDLDELDGTLVQNRSFNHDISLLLGLHVGYTY